MGCSGGNFQIITLFELCTIYLQLGIKILKVCYGSWAFCSGMNLMSWKGRVDDTLLAFTINLGVYPNIRTETLLERKNGEKTSK